MKVRNFDDTLAKLSPEVRAEAEALASQMIAEMALAELRAARDLSQEQLAKILNISQPAVAKIERQTDMYLSTLRNIVTAMGGTLELIAHFPEGDVRIRQLSLLAATECAPRPKRVRRRTKAASA
jgi:transcriptional regulator with XRE-family HTH domain